MSPDELAARYVGAVVRTLPQADRTDVAAELTVLIDDAFRERAQATGRPEDEALMAEVLLAFGAPSAMAEQYGQPPRLLIGPTYLPAYWLTLQIMAALVAGVALFSVVWSTASGAAAWDDAFMDSIGTLGGLVGTLLANVGLITVAFAAIERLSPSAESTAAWNPRDLPAVGDPDHVHRPDRVAELGFDVLFLSLFNLAVLRGSLILGGNHSIESLRFTPEFLPLAPLINLMLGASIVVGALLVFGGRWTGLLRSFDVALGGYTLFVFLQILAAGDIVESHGLSVAIKLLLSFLAIVVGFETVQQCWRLISGRAASRFSGEGTPVANGG